VIDEPRFVRLTMPAKAEYIALCRLALAGISQLREIPDETLHDLKLALTEACTNSIRHAYDAGTEGTVQIVYELGEQDISIEVIDEGEGFVLDEASEADRMSESGLGIAIIRALADELEIDHGDGRGSRLRFVKHLGAAA
jgi:serine/threonine-protein kinase RsbW